MVESVVVLNKYHQFHAEVNLRKALKWLIKDKIEVIVSKDEEIRSIEFRFKIPLVVRLKEFGWIKIKKPNIPYSDGAVYNRDNNECQYWHFNDKGHKFVYKCTELDRTIDHIQPVSRGGKTSFENCICACRHCNIKIKKNRTPEESGLKLRRKPKTPQLKVGDNMVIRFVYNPKKDSHKSYIEWLKQFSIEYEGY